MQQKCSVLQLTAFARPTSGTLARPVWAGCGRWPGWSGGRR